MPDASGMLQSFTIAKTLILIPVPLLVAVLATTVGALAARSKVGRLESRLAPLCAGAALLSLGLAVFHVAELTTLPKAQGYLFCHLAQGVRIGSLETSLALALDPLVAPLLVAVSTIGTAVLLVVSITARREPPTSTALGASSLLLAAMQTMLLASGFFLLLLSWFAVVVASLVLLGRRAVSGAAGIAEVLLVGAAALLFWAYGGGWHAGNYVPEQRPRMVAVQLAAPQSSMGTAKALGGQLTLRALAGTRIGLGGAELCAVDAGGRSGGIGLGARPCREPARSPFARLAVPAAIHDFHLFAGHGTNELVVEKVRIEAGRETLFTLLGPTLDFRELSDQLLVRELAGEKAVRRTLQRSEILGLPALPIALILVVLAAATKVVRIPRVWAKALPQSSPAVVALVCGLAAVAGVYLLARLDFLAALTPGIAALGTVLGSAIAVRAAVRAFAEHDLRRATLLVAVAHGGIAFSGVTGGAAGPSVLYLALAASAACAFALALGGQGFDSRKSIRLSRAQFRARWLGALALSASPLPVLGAMLERVSAEEGARYLPGLLVAVLLAAGSGMISFAVWCGHYRALARAANGEQASFADFGAHTACVLAAVAVAGGLICGYQQGLGQSRIALLASLVLPLYGWVAARRRRATSASDDPARSPWVRWFGASAERALDRRASGWTDAIGFQLFRIERFLYAPLAESTKPTERPEGER